MSAPWIKAIWYWRSASWTRWVGWGWVCLGAVVVERVAVLAYIGYFLLALAAGFGSGGPGGYLWAQSSADAPAWDSWAVAVLPPHPYPLGFVLQARQVLEAIGVMVVVVAVVRYGWKGFLLPAVYYWAARGLGFSYLRGVGRDWGWPRDWLFALIGLVVAVGVAWLLARRGGREVARQVLRWGGVALLVFLLGAVWAWLAGPTLGANEFIRAQVNGGVKIVALSLWEIAGGLIAYLGLFLVLEGTATRRPQRRLLTGAVVAAFAWLATATLFAGGLRFPAPQGSHYAGDETPPWTYAVYTAAISPSDWSFQVETVNPEYGRGLAQYLAAGRAKEPDQLMPVEDLPSFSKLKKSPMGPAFDYFLSFREGHLGNTAQLHGLLTGVAGQRRPLTALERERWLALVLGHPSGMTEDLFLLANTVNAGRKEEANALLDHIDEVLARIPEGWDAMPDAPRLERLEWLRERVRNMPEQDGAERSLRLVLLGAAGEPLANTPVGVWHNGELPREEPRDNSVPPKAWMSARYEMTDTNGEAIFHELGPGPYGVVAIGGWPKGELGMLGFPIPETPIPMTLPPGETVVVLRSVSQGYYGQDGESEPYLLDSLPAGRLVVRCWKNLSADYCGQTVMAEGKRLPENDYWDNERPAVFALDEDGRPTQIWMHEGGRSEADKHALTLSPTGGE